MFLRCDRTRAAHCEVRAVNPIKPILDLLAAFTIFLLIGAAATIIGIYIEPIRMIP